MEETSQDSTVVEMTDDKTIKNIIKNIEELQTAMLQEQGKVTGLEKKLEEKNDNEDIAQGTIASLEKEKKEMEKKLQNCERIFPRLKKEIPELKVVKGSGVKELKLSADILKAIFMSSQKKLHMKMCRKYHKAQKKCVKIIKIKLKEVIFTVLHSKARILRRLW